MLAANFTYVMIVLYRYWDTPRSYSRTQSSDSSVQKYLSWHQEGRPRTLRNSKLSAANSPFKARGGPSQCSPFLVASLNRTIFSSRNYSLAETMR